MCRLGLRGSYRRAPFWMVIIWIAALALAACDSSPVVMVATPVPPDAGFRTYRHPGGAFSLRLPPDWSVRDVSQGSAIRVEFSPPGNTGLPLTVHIINTGSVLSAGALLEAIDRYQQVINGDPAVYHEIGRNAQGDGSWRLVGVRQTPIGPRQINTFLHAEGAFLAAAEVDLTGLDAAQLMTFRAVINTLRVDAGAALAASSLQPPPLGEGAAPGALEFAGLLAWINPQGELILNGQVINRAGRPLEAIRVTAIMYDAQNTPLAEQSNVVPVEVLADSEAAPFSIRFRGGRPARSVRYELLAAARNAEYALESYLGADQFILGNDLATYNANGFLIVSGDIVNRTQAAAFFVKAIVTVFDEQSRVVAADSVFINDTQLLPGEVGRFEVTFPELGGSAIRYTISVEGKSRPGN